VDASGPTVSSGASDALIRAGLEQANQYESRALLLSFGHSSLMELFWFRFSFFFSAEFSRLRQLLRYQR